ncbi:hypothetical protein JCM10207_004508 [Rhodosporidiobolus poonsookiae]
MHLWWFLLAAGGFRAALLVWGAFQDLHGVVPYTDVDYFVFSDAAMCIVDPHVPNCTPARGPWAVAGLGDPYARSTYRYTPLLAVFLAPNAVWPVFGKVAFALCDLLVGYLLHGMVRNRGASESKATVLVTAIWLFNPIIANISTRGSSEALVGAAVVTALSSINAGRWTRGAVLYGVAVHLKLFPVVYGSSLFAALWRPGDYRGSAQRMARFVLLSLTTFVGLNGVCFMFWGQPFLEETFFYHFRRLDHRHNFAPYYYPYALADHSLASDSWRPLARHSLAAFLPQMALTIGLGVFLGGQDLPMAWLAQTFAFVAFNKVCTSQYFVWSLWLLPPALARIRMTKSRAGLAGVLWIGGQALWLSQAYRLEMAGEERHREVWLAGILFLVAQSWVLRELLEGAEASVHGSC